MRGLAVLDWIRTGAGKQGSEENNHVLSSPLTKHPITKEFVESGPDGTTRVKVSSIFESGAPAAMARARAARRDSSLLRHGSTFTTTARWKPPTAACRSRNSAQSTHVHLLGFAMLYGLTGFIVAFTSYPGWFRGVLCPLPLVAQVVDISFWWPGRMDCPRPAHRLHRQRCCHRPVLAGVPEPVQHVWPGRQARVIMLILAGCLGGYIVKERVIDPYMVKESMIT